jgi:predicted Zn-dependent protease with MMP-like domain
LEFFAGVLGARRLHAVGSLEPLSQEKRGVMARRQQKDQRIPLRMRIDPLALTVATQIVGGSIFTIAVTSRTPQLLWGVAIVIGIWAALDDDEDPAATNRSGNRERPSSGENNPPREPMQAVGTLSDEEFDALLDEVDRQAALLASGQARTPTCVAALGDDEFEELVRDAVDDLPDFVLRELESQNIAVTVSDAGHKFGAYGLYVGGSLAYDGWASQILIFRDTLTRDFGADRDELRDQVIRVVRHEVAHHLGAGEREVRDLGL